MAMRDLVDELAAKRARSRSMGGDDAVARQHAAGKLTVRERLDLLFDAGSFGERAPKLLDRHEVRLVVVRHGQRQRL